MAVDNSNFAGPDKPTGPNAPRFRLPEFSVIGIPGGGLFGATVVGSSHDGVPRTDEHVHFANPIQSADSQPFAVVTGLSATPAHGNPNLTPAPTATKGQFDISTVDIRTWFPGLSTIFHVTRRPGEGTDASGDAPSLQRRGWQPWNPFSW
jgi:hypothetical protein